MFTHAWLTSDRGRRAGPVVVGLAFVVGNIGCLFTPDIEQYGYTTCTSDDDCPAGRSCDVDLCAPPPWFEDVYKQRQAIVVKNPSDDVMVAGSALPVVFGVDGLVDAYPGIETRFLDWNEERSDEEDPTAGWIDVPIFRDIEGDKLTAWFPLVRDVKAGAEDVLAWIYTARDDKKDLLVEDAREVFSFFDNTFFNAVGDLDDTKYATFGSGVILVENGRVNVADNQQLTMTKPLLPPFHLTAHVRVNGNLCDALFVGVVSNDTRAGNDTPYAGFFFGDGLRLAADVAPTVDAVPTFLSPARETEQPGALHRYEITVADGGVRFSIDGVVFEENAALIPAFVNDTPLFFTVDTDGDCSADVEAIYVTERPFDAPTFRVEAPVEFRGFQ